MLTSTCSTMAMTQPAMRFRLMPAGRFRAIDGRPFGLEGWLLDGEAARGIITQIMARKNDVLIDYEHQSINHGSSGKAPAAGWFKNLEWRDGDGLYVTDARWTKEAASMLTKREYRYISPVFNFDKDTGRVLSLVSAAITNTPALDGLTDLASATRQSTPTRAGLSNKDMDTMKHCFGPEIFKQMAAMQTHEATCSVPPPGLSAHDHAKLQAVFGQDYALSLRRQDHPGA